MRGRHAIVALAIVTLAVLVAAAWFQPRDAAGDQRLGRFEPLGGLGETAGLRDTEEGAKIIEVDVGLFHFMQHRDAFRWAS